MFNATSSFNQFWNTKVLSNDAYSRNNLPKIEDGAYIINLDEYELIWSHWIAFYVNDGNVTYLIVLELNIFQKKN